MMFVLKSIQKRNAKLQPKRSYTVRTYRMMVVHSCFVGRISLILPTNFSLFYVWCVVVFFIYHQTLQSIYGIYSLLSIMSSNSYLPCPFSIIRKDAQDNRLIRASLTSDQRSEDIKEDGQVFVISACFLKFFDSI